MRLSYLDAFRVAIEAIGIAGAVAVAYASTNLDNFLIVSAYSAKSGYRPFFIKLTFVLVCLTVILVSLSIARAADAVIASQLRYLGAIPDVNTRALRCASMAMSEWSPGPIAFTEGGRVLLKFGPRPAYLPRPDFVERTDLKRPLPVPIAPRRLVPRQLTGVGRVEVWRGGVRLSMSVPAPFVWRCPSGSAVAPFPHAE